MASSSVSLVKSGKRLRLQAAEAEEDTVNRLRARGLVNPETRGRPIILYFDARFWVLFNGTLALVREVQLKTLRTFLGDIQGSSPPVVDVENLTTTQFVQFSRLLSVCIASETEKAAAEDAAAEAIAKEEGAKSLASVGTAAGEAGPP